MMSAHEAIYLSSIEYVLGSLLPMSQALAGQVGPELMRKLGDGGFSGVAVAERGAVELAAEAAGAVLTRGKISAAAIDAVVYATCSFWGDEQGEANRGCLQTQLLVPLGLVHALLSGVALAESGNLASALRVACNLVRSGDAETVLVVTADRLPRVPGEYRAMPNATAINSDGAAACLITREPRHGFEVEHIAQHANPRILVRVKGDGFGKYLDIVAGLRAAASAVFRATGASPDQYRWLVTNNYSVPTIYGFAEALEVRRERVFVDNVARFAHAFAADGLINLADLLAAAAAAGPGERVLALSTGPLTWGAISLRRC